MYLLSLVLAISFSISDALNCASCLNITSPTDCHTYVQCSTGDRCFTTSNGVGTETMYSLGCKTESECLSSSPIGLVGRALGSQCSQCCAVDNCNNKLCSAGTQVTNEVGQCRDDPAYNCQQVSSLFNLCADVVHAKTACRKWCGLCDLVDGGWSVWTGWSTCDVTCEDGHMTRTRTCSDPAPAHGGLPCSGNATDLKSCTLSQCPIHGGWSGWNSWNTCSHSCSIGTQARRRSCDNPTPQIAGNHCFGDPVDFRACFSRSCVVHGGWSGWNSWNTCSHSCSIGTQARRRSCDNPTPQIAGNHCFGDPVDFRACFSRSCVDGVWSLWSSWSTCSSGLRTRNRVCNNPRPSTFGRDCSGNNEEWSKCGTVAFTVASPNTTLVNGHPIFKKIVTNIGGGYDPTTATFTCPISGLYQFTFTVRSSGSYQVSCWIYKNVSNLVYAQTDGNSYNTASITTYLQLSIGDTVYLSSCYNWDHVYQSVTTTFSGVLI